MDRTELFQLTARLRRTFPRHGDVLVLCDEAERLAVPAPTETFRSNPETGLFRPKRDRAAYMRDWRRGVVGSKNSSAPR